MLFTGIILNPYALNLLDPSILSISADLRQLALVIILTRAGLALDLDKSEESRATSFADVLLFLPALKLRDGAACPFSVGYFYIGSSLDGYYLWLCCISCVIITQNAFPDGKQDRDEKAFLN